jgi:hypothetical protein
MYSRKYLLSTYADYHASGTQKQINNYCTALNARDLEKMFLGVAGNLAHLLIFFVRLQPLHF